MRDSQRRPVHDRATFVKSARFRKRRKAGARIAAAERERCDLSGMLAAHRFSRVTKRREI